MNKELEALEQIKITLKDECYGKWFDKEINIIKYALKRKEKLEKEQEELIEHNNYLSNQVDILTKENEKLEKVWKIVKKLYKNDEYINLIFDSIREFETFSQFKDELNINDEQIMAETDFNLLKEELEK